MVNYLSVENISKSYGERILFEEISFGINKDQKIAFVAKNGSGKTSILNIIAGLDMPDNGQVISRKGIQISYLAQNDTLDPKRTIKEVVFSSENKTLQVISQYNKALEEPENTDAYQKAFELMEFFLKNNTNIDHLFAMLVTQLFKVKIYCVHYKNNHSFTKLMNDYKLKNFQIKHLEKFIKNEPITSIDKILDDLYKIDLKTKKNFIDKHHLITLFLLKKYNH